MVAAEAAAAGCPPIVANHSGLAEIAQGLDEDYPPKLRHLASFPTQDVSVLTERLNETLGLGERDRGALRAAARQAAVERWSWTSVARDPGRGRLGLGLCRRRRRSLESRSGAKRSKNEDRS